VGHIRGTLRVAEEHHDNLTAEVGERPRLSVVIGELEIAPEGHPGDVDAWNRGSQTAYRDRAPATPRRQLPNGRFTANSGQQR
jgi:hypothetical protein